MNNVLVKNQKRPIFVIASAAWQSLTHLYTTRLPRHFVPRNDESIAKPGRKTLLFLGLFMGFGYGMTPSSAWALTINDVVVDLACPCQCPLVLQDCNMSCGLSWKSQVGELINKGMSKQQIIDYFVGKYGEAARITPLQRIQGKIYQYTRGFSKVDLAVLWSGIAVWIILMLFGVYIGVKKTFFNKPQAREGSL